MDNAYDETKGRLEFCRATIWGQREKGNSTIISSFVNCFTAPRLTICEIRFIIAVFSSPMQLAIIIKSSSSSFCNCKSVQLGPRIFQKFNFFLQRAEPFFYFPSLEKQQLSSVRDEQGRQIKMNEPPDLHSIYLQREFWLVTHSSALISFSLTKHSSPTFQGGT